jgi:ActR/RegA family two-component response regulator
VVTVLIVDDSDVARRALAKRLARDGHAPVEHASATAGCAASVDGVACAVLDLDLGDGDGVEVAEALRARAPDLPIAFFSGASRSALAGRALAYGHVYAKPDELDAVAAWVNGVTALGDKTESPGDGEFDS